MYQTRQPSKTFSLILRMGLTRTENPMTPEKDLMRGQLLPCNPVPHFRQAAVPQKTLRFSMTLILIFLLGFFGCYSWSYADSLAEPAGSNIAPVVIDGIELFNVAGAANYPAKRRAREIAIRIVALAKNHTFDPSSLQAIEDEDITLIQAGDKLVMAVLKEDVLATGIALTRANLIAKEIYLKNIVKAIQSYRNERTTEVLMSNSIQALLRTAILSLLLFVVYVVFKKLDQLLERRFKIKIETLEAKSMRIVSSRQIWSGLQNCLRAARIFIFLFLVYLFLNFVFSLFPWTRHVGNILLGYLISPLIEIAYAVLDYLPNLFFLALLLILVRYILKLTHAFFSGIVQGHIKFAAFEAEWAWPTYRIARAITIMLALVVAYPYIPGSDSEAFKGISLLLGVLLSLGSTSLISNVIAGYTMTYRRAFRVGDWVKIGDNIGEITQIRVLMTHLRSIKNEEIVVPNSSILNAEIVNYSSLAKETGLILHTEVGIGYEVPWRQVEAMLLTAAEQTSLLLRSPAPFILQKALGDFSVIYELNVACAEPAKMALIYSDLHRNIQDVFNEYNVQIMTPHYERDPEQPKTVPKDKWNFAPAASPLLKQDADAGSQLESSA